LGRVVLRGDDGTAIFVVEGAGAGEMGLARFNEAGEAVRIGDAGRASFETLAIAGLAGRGMPPGRWSEAGELGRGIPAARRVTRGGGGTRVPTLLGLLGPATRRNRSSSWVLSFGDKVPTSDQTCSPTKEYASLEVSHVRRGTV
jgi:hypothetical protein